MDRVAGAHARYHSCLPPPNDRREQIVQAAELLLRRYGVDKTNIVDVAKEVGLSHAAVYKYFPTKTAVQEAVAERWLARILAPLYVFVEQRNAPEEALRGWVTGLAEAKRKKVLDDFGLFETYHKLAIGSDTVVAAHLSDLEAQITQIIENGRDAGVFVVHDARQAARAVLNATVRFHHPYFVMQQKQDKTAGSPDDLAAVLDLLLAGLRAGVSRPQT